MQYRIDLATTHLSWTHTTSFLSDSHAIKWVETLISSDPIARHAGRVLLFNITENTCIGDFVPLPFRFQNTLGE